MPESISSRKELWAKMKPSQFVIPACGLKRPSARSPEEILGRNQDYNLSAQGEISVAPVFTGEIKNTD
jgi:hypothetical protein